MANTHSRQRKSQLVLGYLEGISSRVFSEFSEQITQLVGQRQGVYALYKGNRLYYVGLATNLRLRVKQHLRDRHAGRWNKFSVYLVRKSHHIKELESLILRIADPAGNAVRGRFADARNLRPEIRQSMKATIEERIAELLGPRKKRKAAARKTRRTRTRKIRGVPPRKSKDSAALAPYVSTFFKIRGSRKGKSYEGWVHKDGMIKYGDKVFWSPSGAAKAALGGPVNGWTFWRFRRNGEWVKLAELRKGGARRKTKTSGGQPIDTVVVPARAAGFEDVFLGEDRWYAVSIGKAKIPAIKYIAAYQVRPVSAITHYARVESIKPWKGGPKCVVRFKGPARKIGPISLVDNGRVPAPQGLRYTSWARLKQASNLDKVF